MHHHLFAGATYIEDRLLDRLIAAAIDSIAAGRDTPDHLKIIFGELADIWPASILPYVVLSQQSCDRSPDA